VLYFSSSSVYPVYEQTGGRARPLPEHMVRAALDIPSVGVPDQLYGWAKLTGENLAHRACAAGLNISVVRPFSGYGSDQDASYPFPAFIDRALRREDPFTIWSAGDQVRDFIHIDDIVRACMAMYEQGIDGPVNLGTGRGTTMTELASMVCAQAHYTPGFKFDLAAPRGVTCRVADVSLLRGFCEPEITLDRGIAQALAWRRRNRQLA
jgi:nucleoside-diphosphate-sugar epimerase